MVGYEMAEEGEVRGYADAAGEEQDGAVGGQGGRVAVGAFEEGGDGEAGFEGAVVEVGCEAGAAAEEEGDGVLRGGGRVLLDFWGGSVAVFQVVVVVWGA